MATILMLGLPRTGKTTFLAAFWEAVEGSHSGQLVLSELPPEAGYLNEIRAAWQRCEEISRTAAGQINRVTLRLQSQADGGFDLAMPDLSGEYFREAWENRVWPRELDELVGGADGYLFFIHSQVARSVSFDEVEPIAAAGPSAGAGNPRVGVWDPAKTSTQVKAVDVLQMVLSRRREVDGMPLVVVISAWDLVESGGQTPSQWLSKELPLLDQFLRTNSDRFKTQVVGVSAQGGDLSQAAELMQLTKPVDRIRVVSQDGPNDITAPVHWIGSRLSR
jgi:hypothetical protein